MASYLKKAFLIDILFLLNAIVSSLPLIIIIFFLLDTSITEKDISLLFSLKFWSVSIFSLAFIPLSKRLSIKNIIILSAIIKLFAYLFFSLEQTLYSSVLLVALNALSAVLFSTASKLYLQQTSTNISLSLSRRFTINNIGVSLAPFFLALSDNINYMVNIALFLTAIATLFAFSLQNIAYPPSEQQQKKVKINYKLSVFIFLSCFTFALFYLTYEKNIPIILERAGRKDFYSFIVVLNTLLIILLQIKLYALMSSKIGVKKALLLSYAVCMLSYIPFFSDNNNYAFIILFVIGVTYLEMFFATGVDAIIIQQEKGASKYYFVLFNIFIAIGISLSTWILTLGNYIPLIAFISWILLCFCMVNMNKEKISN